MTRVTEQRDRRLAMRLGGLAVFASMCVAIFVWLFTLAGGELRVKQPYGIEAVVPTAVTLVSNADVREAGTKIGKVRSLSNRGGTAVLKLEIDGDHAPVYRDARVRVRTKTLIGENYLELIPGTPKAGSIPNGGLLPISHAEPVVQIDEIFSALDRPTRARLQRLLDGLGGGLEHRGDDLNRLLETSSALVDNGGRTIGVLGRERANVAALVDDLGRVMAALGERRDSIRVLARSSRRAAEAVASREQMLARTLRELPLTLRRARTATTTLGALSGEATPVVGDLGAALDRLAPAIDVLGPAARRTRATMAQLGGFNREATPLLVDLRRFSAASVPAVPALDELLRQANPLVRYLAPYSRNFGAFFANQRSITNSYDALGHLGRIQAVITPSSYAGFTPQMAAALDALERAGAVQRLVKTSSNAYPAPGTLGNPSAYSGPYPRLTEDPSALDKSRR